MPARRPKTTKMTVEQRCAEQFNLLAGVSQQITSILDINELLVQVVRLIQQTFGYYHVAIGLIEGDELVYRVGAGQLWDNPEFIFKPSRLKIGQEGVGGWVAATGEPLLVPDVSQEPHYVWMQGSQTQSELNVPILVKGKPTGVLDIQSNLPNDFDQTDLQLMKALANQVGVALENARLFREEQRRVEQFRVLTEVSQRITTLLSLDELLEQIARLIQETFAYYHVGIGLVEGEEVVSKAEVGAFADVYRGFRIPLGQSTWGWVAQHGQPLLSPNVEQDQHFLHTQTTNQTRSHISVPLIVKGSVIGVLSVASDRLNAFDESDQTILQTLANQASVAIENARLYEQARQIAVFEERQRMARELHDSVTQSLYGMGLYSQAAERHLDMGNLSLVTEELHDIQDTAHEALAEMRLMIFELRPPILEKEGLQAALQIRLSSVEDRAGMKTRIQTNLTTRLPTTLEERLYRVAHEALNNALKHSRAQNIAISLRQEDKRVVMEISDDGVGFDPTSVTQRGGMGLPAMEERVTAMGGRLVISSQPGAGTRVRVEAPL